MKIATAIFGFLTGAEWERSRTSAIDKALIDCADALIWYRHLCITGPSGPTAFADEALAALEQALELAHDNGPKKDTSEIDTEATSGPLSEIKGHGVSDEICSVEFTCEGGIFECQRAELMKERDELRAEVERLRSQLPSLGRELPRDARKE